MTNREKLIAVWNLHHSKKYLRKSAMKNYIQGISQNPTTGDNDHLGGITRTGRNENDS